MPETHKELREQLQNELRKLFQFDASDLDFGIYRILNRKKDQIEQFIEKDLLDAVSLGLKAYQKQDLNRVDELRQQVIENLSEAAFDEQGNLVEGFRDIPIGQRYLEAVEAQHLQQVGEDTEKKIFNDLYTFFSRYYSDGDFLTHRRISTRDSKYAVPYNGEEVLLHWANKDQYYIKTGENFTNYKFTAGDHTVWFKISKAETEKDNVKESESRDFVLRPENPLDFDEETKTLTVWFEYREITKEETEKWLTIYSSVEKPRKTIDRQALCIAYDEWIRKNVTDHVKQVLSVVPKNKDRSTLYYKLNHYTAKNSTDFFIHKDLQGFLERELEYYLKQEVIRVDDFIEDDSEQAISVALTRAKVVREIAKKIIAFLSQIENFQKKLFEKKKFVVDTHYCFTLDKIPEELYETILENKAQLQSWEELYGMDKWSGELQWDGKWTVEFMKEHPFMMVDTQFFDEEFKFQFLNSSANIEELLSGTCINGDNYHAIRLLNEKFECKFQAMYLDPPYNAEASEILYKNSFKHSSWITFLSTRFDSVHRLLNSNSMVCVTIDDNEVHNLAFLLDEYFGSDNHLGTVPIRNNPQGRSTVKGFSINHEYALFYGNNAGKNEVGRLEHSEDQIERYNEIGEDGRRFLWENFRKTGTDSQRRDRSKQFYPIYTDGESLRIPKMEWNESKDEWDIQEKPNDQESIIYPIDSNSNERVWKWGSKRAKEYLCELKVVKSQKGIEINRKNYLNVKGSLPNTWWHDSKYAAGSHGTNLLTSLFGKGHEFSFPKSVYAVEDSLRICDLKKGDHILDFFAGSGTTGHAVLNLNKLDNGNRRYFLVEMGQYFNTVLIPRIKKVVFGDNWKDGIPQSSDGQSHAFKYHFIESYEDALNNIDFKNPEEAQQAMEFEDYLLSYMLDFETDGVSPTKLTASAFETPFNYQLHIQRGHESPAKEKVDLVETFHYLIGLWVHTLRRYEHQDRYYVISTGQIRKEEAVEEVLIIWRNTSELDLDAEATWIGEEIIKDQTYDRVYVNGQSKIPDAEPTEITFREKMFEDVS